MQWSKCVSWLQAIHGKVEEVHLPEKVDILISEPMGESFSSYQTWAEHFGLGALDIVG
jgi:hypothetical protein